MTGAWTRDFGREAIERELTRAQRLGVELVLAFVDVEALKGLNDSDGHDAGDVLLTRVADTIRSRQRAYDLLVRWGGDEFLCVIGGISLAAARNRLNLVAGTLREADPRHSIAFGLVEAHHDETLDELIARADADLLTIRTPRDGEASQS